MCVVVMAVVCLVNVLLVAGEKKSVLRGGTAVRVTRRVLVLGVRSSMNCISASLYSGVSQPNVRLTFQAGMYHRVCVETTVGFGMK